MTTLNRLLYTDLGLLDLIKLLITLAACGFFVLVVLLAPRLLPPRTPASPARHSVWGWLIGFAAPLILLAGLNIVVNPRELYGTRFFEPRALNARAAKISEYPRLPYDPQIVVLGSSRARALGMDAAEQYAGLSLYNASVSAGFPLDSLVFARFMAAQDSHPFPQVLLVEVQPGIRGGLSPKSVGWPWPSWPYVPRRMLIETVKTQGENLFSLGQVSESLYVLVSQQFASESQTRREGWTFGPDGSGWRTPVSQEKLDQVITEAVVQRIDQARCTAVDPGFADTAEALIALAEREQSAVVFYYSPRHPRIVQAMLSSPGFERCYAAYSDYFARLSEQRRQVFFLDYLGLESIGGDASNEGFYDTDHMTPRNGARLIEAASATLREAYALAQNERTAS